MTNDGFVYQASPKDGDVLINVRGATPEEFAQALLDFPVAAYAQFKANLAGASALGQIVQPAQQQAPAAPAAPQWQQSQQPAPTWATGPSNGSPHPEGKACGCGQVLQYKAFTSKGGKALKMWTCPLQKAKNDGHAIEWID